MPILNCEIINSSLFPSIYHVGPPLSMGPLPSLFYFSLSGKESLTLAPYNQLVELLQNNLMRIFSLTLPGHEEGYDHQNAMKYWANQIENDDDVIQPFVTQCKQVIDFLIQQNYINRDNIAVAGLSRGSFIAAHVAAQDDRVKTILGFAPLTNLMDLIEFQGSMSLLAHNLALHSLVDRLVGKKLRFYIGNRDKRVNTHSCFTFIEALVEATYTHRHRSYPVELIIYPSVGHKGHGTPPHIFHEGALWLKQQLI